MYSQTGLGGKLICTKQKRCQQPCDLTAASGNINISFIILLNSEELYRSKWTQLNLTTSTKHRETSMQQIPLKSTVADRQTTAAPHTEAVSAYINSFFMLTSRVKSLETLSEHWAHSHGSSTQPFHWLPQPLTGSIILLWDSLLMWVAFFKKGTKGSLQTQEECALTSEQGCTAGRSGARIPSGAGCAAPGGNRRTCSAPPGSPQTCSRPRAQNPESWCWSSAVWRCPRERRVPHRPWELLWEAKRTQGEALQTLPGSPGLPLAAGCGWQEGSHLQEETDFREKHGASYVRRTIKHSQNHKTKIALQASKLTALEKSFS